MMQQIKYIGLNDLDQEDKIILKTIVEKEFPKVERFANKVENFEVRIRIMKKESRKRFILNLDLKADNKVFRIGTKDTEKAGDWDLAKLTYKSMESLRNEVEHGLRRNSDRWEKSKIKRLLKRLRFGNSE